MKDSKFNRRIHYAIMFFAVISIISHIHTCSSKRRDNASDGSNQGKEECSEGNGSIEKMLLPKPGLITLR